VGHIGSDDLIHVDIEDDDLRHYVYLFLKSEGHGLDRSEGDGEEARRSQPHDFAGAGRLALQGARALASRFDTIL
jgi:hypothetical protein